MIKKKTWPDLFQKMVDGKKNVDCRLADFDLEEGYTLILEECESKTKKYTGRTLQKKIKHLNKVFLTDYHLCDDIKKYGHWVIELE
ncbi:DUF3850 domain-containing protein [Candidatus Woesearchaeota archaeon]|nr:DUF3850 domain-containing protein [Candidatus Woesearchaeota archaeon]